MFLLLFYGQFLPLIKKDTDITISHISRTFTTITYRYGTQVEGICCFSFADPDPGSSVFFNPSIRIQDGKKYGSGSGLNIPNHFSESLKTFFWVKNT
jgi:hypothetical protein